MPDIDICCNVIKCRKPLTEEAQACITSCSHIFCMDCSRVLFSKSLVCPACNATLSQDCEDIIITQLNPTEEYKSSVLAGLKPDVILDICSRAIAFYEYQASQELSFRTMLQKSSEEKYNQLKSRFDLVSRDVNHILKAERGKQKAILQDAQLEKARLQQVQKQYEEKSRQFQKLKLMYEKLKRKSFTINIQESLEQQPNIIQPSHSFMSFNTMNSQRPVPIVDKSDDVYSRIERSSTKGRSVFIPPQSHQQNRPKIDPTYAKVSTPMYHTVAPPVYNNTCRIPSPTRSIYTARSNRQAFFNTENSNQQRHSSHRRYPDNPSEP